MTQSDREAGDAMLDTQRLSLVYRTRRGAIEALRDVDLRIGAGEFVTLLGPSGCGKSTLLKIAAGLLAPTSGVMEIAGEPVRGPRPDIGIAFQKPTLLPWKTVLANVIVPAETLGQDLDQARQRARELLALMGLQAFADNYPNELSGGMQQRVGLARMLLRDPRLLLMDEPFSALDALTREHLMLELQRVWMRDQKSVMFITHSIPEAVFLSDRVLVMSARPGRIVEDFRIHLPRPRSMDTMATAEFAQACQHLRQHFSH
ncbi:ABC transporter ATP-binding protein [Bordetella ansorpii]|uniref:ABC transporter ATP-binding protein n=1 Tax=Bordetella ansorpii TaxID=288768 RepID=A0A157Q4M7_9BORD|nr:ABC transporter ATP-binding protein [Bordetella ansorpii]SAI40832.1 ABC transporter ATP-binding protein [Bordetella ansorpii]